MHAQEATCMSRLSLQRRMRGFLFAALAASAVAPLNIRDFFSSAESKMSAGAHQAVGATKSIVKKVLPPRPQVAGSSVAPPTGSDRLHADTQGWETSGPTLQWIRQKSWHRFLGRA